MLGCADSPDFLATELGISTVSDVRRNQKHEADQCSVRSIDGVPIATQLDSTVL